MPAPLTPKQQAARLQFIIDRLAKNPDLTKGHFYRCGYQYPYLHKIEAEGLVVFGKPKAFPWSNRK